MTAGSGWGRGGVHRITRRRLLQSAGVAGAAGAAWLAGCTGERRPSGVSIPTPRAAESFALLNEAWPPRYGGRYQDSTELNFDTFDPHLGVGASAWLLGRLYNVLVNQSATRPEFMVFDLAESIENPDAITWNFKIRPGVRIAPNDLGVPERDMDAQDAVATFERIKATPQANNGAFVKDFVERVTFSGDVLTIRTTRPYAWFLNRVGFFTNTIPPRELIADDLAIARMRERSAGGGPYHVIASTDDTSARLDRNPNYYGRDARNDNARLPYLDGIDVHVMSERATTRTAFLSGQLHAYVPESKADADDLARSAGVFVDRAPAFSYIALTMNPEQAPFQDARVRRAFSRAINRAEYVDTVFSGDAKPDGLVHWPLGPYALDPEELATVHQPYDVAEARKLVSAVGGIRVKMMYPAAFSFEQHDLHLLVFLAQIRAAGIEIEEDPQPFPVWLDNYRKLNYAVSLAPNQVYETPELPLDAHTSGGPTSDRTYAIGLQDPEIDAAVSKTKEALDLDERIAAVRDAQRVIYRKDPGTLPLVSWYEYTAYGAKLHNVPSGLGTTDRLINTRWLEA